MGSKSRSSVGVLLVAKRSTGALFNAVERIVGVGASSLRVRVLLASVVTTGLIITSTANTARAASITWGTPSTIIGDSDIVNVGSLVSAYSFGGLSVDARTINGVTFSPFPIPDNVSTVTQEQLTVNFPVFDVVSGVSNYGSTLAPFAALSTNYKAMLSTAAVASSSTAARIEMTYSGLAVGNAYTLQMWISNANFDLFFPLAVDDGNGINNRQLDTNSTNGAGGVGQYVVGTFVANSTTQNFRVRSPGSIPAFVNAVQLRTTQVPEPAAASLILLAGISGSMLRRSRHDDSP